jgi:two-component system, cell cycle sensor histidine kinase and response regulator CckA
MLFDKTILIVEDEECIREILTDVLQEVGYRTYSAPTAEDALAQFRNTDKPIDLLITDILLPGRRGPEMAEEFKMHHPGMKVIFMSGYPAERFSPGDIVHRNYFIEKPFTLDMILEKLQQIQAS